MTEFIKIGEKIQVKPNGLDYDLIPGKVYDLKWDNFNDCTYLQENGDLNLPKKLYKFEGDDKFIKRCLTYFNSENSGETTGVLLSGLKGSGKSVLAKRLAKESNLPIIIVDPEYHLRRIEKFFKEVKTPVSYHANGKEGSLSRIINPILGGQIIFCVDRFSQSSTMEQLDLKTAKTVIENIKKIIMNINKTLECYYQ